MRVRFKRIDDQLPVPKYQTGGSVGFDIYSRVNAVVEPKSLAKIPGNLIIKIPSGYALFLVARSSLIFEKGLTFASGVGIVDQDFFGEIDEVQIPVYNTLEIPVSIKKSERLCQGIFVKISKAKLIETKRARQKSREGFGSTGGYS